MAFASVDTAKLAEQLCRSTKKSAPPKKRVRVPKPPVEKSPNGATIEAESESESEIIPVLEDDDPCSDYDPGREEPDTEESLLQCDLADDSMMQDDDDDWDSVVRKLYFNLKFTNNVANFKASQGCNGSRPFRYAAMGACFRAS